MLGFFHYFSFIIILLQIGSEKILKTSDCIPDMLAVDNSTEVQKLRPWSQMSSTLTEDNTDGDNSSWTNTNENEERGFTLIPTPQTHSWFENLAYSSYLAVASDHYQIPETVKASTPELSVALYQPHYYSDTFNEDADSKPRETAGRQTSLRYISQTDVHCIGRGL